MAQILSNVASFPLPPVPCPSSPIPSSIPLGAMPIAGLPAVSASGLPASTDADAVRLFEQAKQCERQGRAAEASRAWQALLELDAAAEPYRRVALNRLGSLLFASGEVVEARLMYERAVEGYDRDPMSRVNLANVLIKTGELDLARAHLQSALDVDPGYRPAHAGLAFVYRDLGQRRALPQDSALAGPQTGPQTGLGTGPDTEQDTGPEAAQGPVPETVEELAELASRHRRAAFSGRSVIQMPYRGVEPPIRLLELISITGGNIRLQNFLSDRIFARSLVVAEHYDEGAALPEHDLVVNMIGDADLVPEALKGAQRVVKATSAPVLNPPTTVLATGRCAIAARLGTIPGMRTARTVTLPRAALAAPDVESRLAVAGLRFPFLLRAPGYHGGDHFTRVDRVEQMPTALAALPGDPLLGIEFLDARGSDGKTRKYRAMMIDGRLYPLHAAVSSDWKIHYFSAEMAEYPEHRAEDAAFLADMAATIGSRAVEALEAAQAALGLDYGGIDFGLDQAGNLLLFEANATMAILPPEEGTIWDYRRPAVERACQAVLAMLRGRAGRVN